MRRSATTGGGAAAMSSAAARRGAGAPAAPAAGWCPLPGAGHEEARARRARRPSPHPAPPQSIPPGARLDDLSARELESLESWERTFESKYEAVGQVRAPRAGMPGVSNSRLVCWVGWERSLGNEAAGQVRAACSTEEAAQEGGLLPVAACILQALGRCLLRCSSARRLHVAALHARRHPPLGCLDTTTHTEFNMLSRGRAGRDPAPAALLRRSSLRGTHRLRCGCTSRCPASPCSLCGQALLRPPPLPCACPCPPAPIRARWCRPCASPWSSWRATAAQTPTSPC